MALRLGTLPGNADLGQKPRTEELKNLRLGRVLHPAESPSKILTETADFQADVRLCRSRFQAVAFGIRNCVPLSQRLLEASARGSLLSF